MAKSVFSKEKGLDFTKQPVFGEDLQVQQYSDMKYLYLFVRKQQQLGYFWRLKKFLCRKIETTIKNYLNKSLYLQSSYQTMLDSVQVESCLAFCICI